MFYTPSQTLDIMLPNRKQSTILEAQYIYKGELFNIKSISGDTDDLVNNGEMLDILSLAPCTEIEPRKRKIERYNINRETNTISIKAQGNDEITLKYKEGGKHFFDFFDEVDNEQ